MNKTISFLVLVSFLFFFSCQNLFPTRSSQGNTKDRQVVITPKHPNILLINVDDLGWADTEAYGSTFYETPNINWLARKGMRFTQAYAAASNCAPSRACMLSGQQTPRHGIYTVANSTRGKAEDRKLIPTPNTTVLVDSFITIAEVLKKVGYQTATFGKWHLGEDPMTQGFDVNVAGYHKGNPGKDGYFNPSKFINLEDSPKGAHLTDELTKKAIEFITEHQQQPFFAYLPFYAVHTPLQTKKELENKYKQKGGNELQNHEIYAGMVETVDTNIGKLLHTLRQLDLLKNTLIIFTSDNGGIRAVSSQHPLRAGKGSYYEGGIRVPLIMVWDKQIAANTLCHTPVSQLDFFPTILELLAISSYNKPLDGISIVPLLKGETIPDRSLHWHFPIYLQAYRGAKDDARDTLFRTRPGSVIRYQNWKLHHYFEDNGLELYNLETDISERENLMEQYPEKGKALLDRLSAWRTALNAPIPTQLNPTFIN